MTSLLRRFLARFLPGGRSADPSAPDPDRFDHPDAHRDVPERDPKVWKYPGASRGPFGIGGRN